MHNHLKLLKIVPDDYDKVRQPFSTLQRVILLNRVQFSMLGNVNFVNDLHGKEYFALSYNFYTV